MSQTLCFQTLQPSKALKTAIFMPRFSGAISFLRDLMASDANLSRTLAHRNRSDFCDLRLRCPTRTPEIARFRRQEKAMLHCDLSVRWKVASDLRFRVAISAPKTSSFCGISGDLAPSTRKSLKIAIVRFWCPKSRTLKST